MLEGGLSLDILKQGLATHFIGRKLQYYASLDSTMDMARQAAFEGMPEGTVILAEEQTAGRGRLHRSWYSTRGCLTFSVILYPPWRVPFPLVMSSSLAVLETIEAIAGLKAEIKWPNDILVNGKKISGILIETGVTKIQQSLAIIGIGLNVNLRLADCPEISATATSFKMATGRQFAPEAVLSDLLNRLESRYEDLLSERPVFEAWRARLSTLGKQVTIQTGETGYSGLAQDVASDGSIMLKLADGRVVMIPAGDVSLRS